jgi:hypothetical protein
MMQKSIPLFIETQPPHSAVAKILLREILKEKLEPLPFYEVKQLKKQRKARKRVFLTEQDTDLIEFFYTAPLTLQFAVFKRFNEKLQEVKP